MRDPQRRLNPNMTEVVKNETLKLLVEGLIYSEAESERVRIVHMVPKNIRENNKREIIPARVTIGWKMYIDYGKLNVATREDHPDTLH